MSQRPKANLPGDTLAADPSHLLACIAELSNLLASLQYRQYVQSCLC